MAGNRTAVVVGIDDTDRTGSFGTEKMVGPSKDALAMGETLGELYGYAVTSVPSKQATLARIRAAIASSTEKAGAGDQFVFFFSGRGSVDANGSPTLLPLDASPRNSQNDLPVEEIAKCASKLEKAGVQVTVVLDASFGDPKGAARGGDYQHYRNEPRHFQREIRPRPDWSYPGAGVYLAPVRALGGAFEKVSAFNANAWEGLFTSEVLEAVKDRVGNNQSPTVGDIFQSVRDDIQVEKMMDRYGGTDPYLKGPGERLLFGGTEGRITEKGRAAIARSAAVRADLRSHLNVAIALDANVSPSDRQSQYQDLAPKFEAIVSGIGPSLKVVPRGGGSVNLVLEVGRFGEEIRCHVRGDETVDLDKIVGKGASPSEAMSDGVKEYLLSKAMQWVLCNRFRYGEPTQRDPAWKVAPMGQLKTDDQSDDDSTLWRFTLEGLRKNGWLLVFEREEPTRTANLKLPHRYEPEVLVESGSHILPHGKFVMTHPGVTRVWVVWMEAIPGVEVDLPALEDSEPEEYTRALNKLLSSILAATEQKNLRWDMRELQYRVVK